MKKLYTALPLVPRISTPVHPRTWLLSLCFSLIITGQISAATINVSSLSALQTAINNASPGDIIILANGVYAASTAITISRQGTAAQPITIEAQTIAGAEITGTAGINLASPAAYIVIQGFKFTFSASQATMASGTSFCRWTHNLFQCPGTGEYLLLNGNDQQVDYNTFQNKNALGRFIAVRGTGSQIAQRLWIHHNYFFSFLPQTGNGAETLQFGLSGYSLSSSNSIVEYNVFEQCAGENELISVKASAVTLRYNTIRDCPAQFTLRHGNRNLVYGNYFINTPGLRIFGDDHKIYSNHFENCNPAINVGNGDGEVADGAPLTSHDRPDRVLIAFNTLVNNTSNITQGARTGGLGATYITVVNNIIQGGGPAATLSGPYASPVWQGNILFNTNGNGDMPSGGYTTIDPKLARDATGTFHLQPGSPAINTATGAWPVVTTDMDGQTRTAPLDVGADEVSANPVTATILTAAQVGYTVAAPACAQVMASADDGNVAANTLDNNLATRWSASGDGQWIQFCLPDPAPVSGVDIAFYNGNTRSSTFDVLVSADAVNWTTAATGLVSSGASTAFEHFTFAPESAKNVRIVGHGNSTNAWNSYTEVRIRTGQQYTMTPVADAYVRDGIYADSAFGASDSNILITKLNSNTTTGNDRQSFLRFDVGGVGGTISSAVLRLYGKLDDNRNTNVPVSAYAVANTAWLESAITWNNKPAAGALLQTATVADSVARYYNWDITSYVQGEQAAGRPLISLALLAGTATSPRITWNSKETGSNPPQLVLANYSDSVTQQSTPALRKAVEAAAVNELPLKTALSSYPNPFRETNTIQFSLASSGHTLLTVYDITGKQVAVLVNEDLPAGIHHTSLSSKLLPGGVYILKLVHNGQLITGKLVKE